MYIDAGCFFSKDGRKNLLDMCATLNETDKQLVLKAIKEAAKEMKEASEEYKREVEEHRPRHECAAAAAAAAGSSSGATTEDGRLSNAAEGAEAEHDRRDSGCRRPAW